MSGLEGSLFTADAKLLDQRLNVLADSVCAADPRPRAARHADALARSCGCCSERIPS